MGIRASGGRFGLVSGMVLIAAQSGGSPAMAQQASAGGEQSGTLDDIIVTAEKRSESLEKVPLSVVAYSAETLAEIGVQDWEAPSG
jgi:iron complex outermembrane receptor protein